MSYKYRSIAITDEGCVRDNNEDNFYICGYYKKNTEINKLKKNHSSADDEQLFAVFDGMGGYEDGEKASLIAAEKMKEYEHSFNYRVPSYVEATNEAICDYRTVKKCMLGSTYVSLFICNDKAYISNIGDSKAF